MQEHVKALQQKMATTSAALAATLPWAARARPWQVALTTFNVSLANHLVGDMYVRPRYGDSASAITQGANAGLVTSLTARALPGMQLGTVGTVAVAGAVFLSEWFAHAYLEEGEQVKVDKPSVNLDMRSEPERARRHGTSGNGHPRPARRGIPIKRYRPRESE